MIRRLIRKLQGKIWGAHCLKCDWTAGRTDLKLEHASNRAVWHSRNASIAPWEEQHVAVAYRKV